MIVEPGGAIGILGGGQLGRMLALAAAELGLDALVLTPDEDSPASRVARYTMVAEYDDRVALEALAANTNVITYEFENVPAITAEFLAAAGALVRPAPRALEVTQDRLVEKAFLAQHGVAVAAHIDVTSKDDIAKALRDWDAPAILKTRRLGYDGQGQVRINAHAEASDAFDKMRGAPAILEQVCAFEREVSIIAARGGDGAIAFYDLCENTHANGILATTRAPAQCARDVVLKAQDAAHAVLDALDYVGVLTIEFFLMPDGSLIANEMAPRVHNSGHWTQDACLTSQFEQHVRAIAGWPLGPTSRVADAEMTNLIGEDAYAWQKLAADPDARLHLYGKRDAREGRKMGHVTRLKRT